MQRFTVLSAAILFFVYCSPYEATDPGAPVDAGREGAASPDAADAGGPADGGADATKEAGCKGTKGPAAIAVGTYCIDATEVTSAHYAEFLAAKAGDTSGQTPECAGNTSFEPKASYMGGFPVAGIDWCDALAFCTWAGKRLCGKIGGGEVPIDLRSNAFADEWFRACSHDGTLTFPYGNQYVQGACVVADAGPPREVGSTPSCEGGYPGIFDIVGNLWEWEASCDGGTCAMRGPSYAAGGGTEGACNQWIEALRDGSDSYDVGIRCCSDLE